MPNFRGLSVTIPHKVAVIEHLDELDALAEKVGSVNTVTNEGGRLIGSSTDGLGLTGALDDAGVELAGKRVLFLGAGGAVRGAVFAVADRIGDGSIRILGRTPSRVEPLVHELQEKTGAAVSMGHLVEDIESAIAEHDVIVQGTPLGMYPELIGESCVPKGSLRPEQVVFDMVYSPLKTKLIQDAEMSGCQVVFGTEMLVHQAAAQYVRWTEQEAPVDVMREALMHALLER
jgi:shikimate dehydrogenase